MASSGHVSLLVRELLSSLQTPSQYPNTDDVILYCKLVSAFALNLQKES
jgi:hypothetical protein